MTQLTIFDAELDEVLKGIDHEKKTKILKLFDGAKRHSHNEGYEEGYAQSKRDYDELA